MTPPPKSPRHLRLLQILEGLNPDTLDIVNDSARHHNHAGDDGSDETHFNITIISEKFSGLSRLQRHRLVNDLLAGEFAHGLHALSCKLLTLRESENNLR